MKYLVFILAIGISQSSFAKKENVLTSMKIFLDNQLVSSPKLLTLVGESGNLSQSNEGHALNTDIYIQKIRPDGSISLKVNLKETKDSETLRSIQRKIVTSPRLTKVISDKEQGIRIELVSESVDSESEQ